MSKYIVVLLVVLALLVTSCAAPASTPAPAAEPAPAEQPAAEAPASEAPAAEAPAEKVTLTIESWRNDDLAIWQDLIIPAFNKQYPNIEVIFAPAAPAEYNGVLNTKLEGGTAGDLITCRPFDASLALYDQGYLASLNDLPGMENFSDVAKSAWITDDGSSVFCVPMASVIHGFIYNQEIFERLGLSEPTTVEEFHAVLDAIKADGSVPALAMGTVDLWEAATMGFQNIGPNYWKGEEGRLGLIAGTEKYSDPQYVAVWEELASWRDYL
ncbi:MAG TPA: ABC transporter substrate-binding protein, partial [Anaerolineae bacterium]|nr:ABC transporter substrate-binding protein [Anaerolineae bacterium]